ncbi:putative ethyl tert-butyl ether degradation protein [Penicillium brasilianum]|uniref:Putative ethyl tert-butyl ether degradation protein n=1 Tax=Penicillium brasilianum TaxID=104259 RepID=A0A1S9RZB5_PENBI|nr:putative ethyl tert-butyl ether degradation protein [Penicillium brasilianum]
MNLLCFWTLSLAAASSVLAFTTTDVAPIELPSLPNDCTPEVYTDAGTIEAIRNTLAIYPFAIDGKNFGALTKVFATDAVANYSAPLNVLTPLSSIQSVLGTALACVTTQHLLGTQWIDVISPVTARSVTYFRAAHFGKGETQGQVLYAYGQYQDNWGRQSDGTWRIAHRNLVYMGPQIGNISVFSC